MARKGKSSVNVAEAIREFLKSKPSVGPSEAAQTISGKIGHKVSPIYVSNIKTMMSGGSKKKGRKERKAAASATKRAVVTRPTTGGGVELATIAAVKDLLGHVSAKTAKDLIDLLA